MAPRHVNSPVGGLLCRLVNRHGIPRDAIHRTRRRGNGDNGAQIDGAVVIDRVERRSAELPVMRRPMTCPMGMHDRSGVMLGRVVVGVGVYERCAHGRSLNSQRKHERRYLPHDDSLLRVVALPVKPNTRRGHPASFRVCIPLRPKNAGAFPQPRSGRNLLLPESPSVRRT